MKQLICYSLLARMHVQIAIGRVALWVANRYCPQGLGGMIQIMLYEDKIRKKYGLPSKKELEIKNIKLTRV